MGENSPAQVTVTIPFVPLFMACVIGGQWERAGEHSSLRSWEPVTSTLVGKPDALGTFLRPYLCLLRKKSLN